MHKPDEMGRYPLSSNEYMGIRHLMAAIDALSKYDDALHDRLKLIKGGWRDYKMLHSVAYKLFQNLLHTIPYKKLKAMREEIRTSVCEVRVNAASVNRDLNLTVVDVDALKDLANMAAERECFMCSKSLHEGKKCPIYNAITACTLYVPDGDGKGACPLAGSAGLNDLEEFEDDKQNANG